MSDEPAIVTSLISQKGLSYPGSDDFFSPDEAFPEYQAKHVSTKENSVYRAVRLCLAQIGLDCARYGTGSWNPLGEFVRPGDQVFVLCNFVYHRRPAESQEEYQGKCTHGSVLRALLDYVLLAAGRTGRVMFGNAPLQSCNWQQVLKDSGAQTVLDFYAKRGCAVAAKDLRFVVAERDLLGRVVRDERRDVGSLATTINLGQDSLLSELYVVGRREPRFRVSDYDPQMTESYHSRDIHNYVINRTVLEADVLVSLPKLKTHEKVGITCGLKGFVGIVGHKDCLAHHRFGGSEVSGDEYPSGGKLREQISEFHDWAQHREAGRVFAGVWQVADRSLRRVLNRLGLIQAGAWSGNDTAWRMAIDLARIAHYADSAGAMHSTPQRINLSLIDGIVGGEGNGPLAPRPVRSGTLIFGDQVPSVDWISARAMGLDPAAFPILREAFRLMKYALPGTKPLQSQPVCWNGQTVNECEVPAVLGRAFLLPRGWWQNGIAQV